MESFQRLPFSEKEYTIKMQSKKQKHSGLSGVPSMVFNLCYLPFLLSVSIPLLIMNIVYRKVKSLVVRKPKQQQRVYPKFQLDKKNQERKFDIVIYGATGFTGQMCAKYISKNYQGQLTWAIAGRSKQKLEEVNEMLEKPVPILIADSSDIDGLSAIICNSKIILNTAGPFDLFGTNVVGLCCSHGTHYVDITGEVNWVRQMIEQYDELAAQSGARIINCCGLDSIPWDLLTLRSGLEMQRVRGEKISKIEFFDTMRGEFSGGTFKTLMNSLRNPPPKSQLGYDPLVKQIGKKEKVTKQFKTFNQKMLAYNSQIKAWTGMWALADGNAAIVRRTHALTEIYANDLVYCEQAKFPNFIAVFNFYFGLIRDGTLLGNSWLSEFYYNHFITQPGSGPSKQEMAQGYLVLDAIATGDKGGKIKHRFTMFDDPGYRDTARLVSEAALTLFFEDKKIKVGGGFWTPASGLGELLTHRILVTGSTLTIEEI